MDFSYQTRCIAYEAETAEEMPSSDQTNKVVTSCPISDCPYGFHRLIGGVSPYDNGKGFGESGMCESGGYINGRISSFDRRITEHPQFVDKRKPLEEIAGSQDSEINP